MTESYEELQAKIDALERENRNIMLQAVRREGYNEAMQQIVRCKECVHRHDDGFCAGRGWPMTLVPDDGFCNYGKRRPDE